MGNSQHMRAGCIDSIRLAKTVQEVNDYLVIMSQFHYASDRTIRRAQRVANRRIKQLEAE